MSYLRYVCYLLIVMSNTCCVVVFVLFLFVLGLVFPMLKQCVGVDVVVCNIIAVLSFTYIHIGTLSKYYTFIACW
jgi:hypothetical protein